MKRVFLVMMVSALVLWLTSCAMFVPQDFKRSEAADGAVLTTLVQRHTLAASAVNDAEAWLRLAEISGNMELRNRWLNGETVDLSTPAK